MRVRHAPRALADLDAIFAYPGAAIAVKRRIQQLAAGLSDFPHAGHETGFRATRVLLAGRFPYLIYYRVLADEIHIVHIRHASRRPWQDEKP